MTASQDDAHSPEDAARHLSRFLQCIGFHRDPETRDAPRLVSRFLAEFDPGRPPPPLPRLSTTGQDPVVIADLPFHSLCAHHLVPFFGHAHVGYRPQGALTGFGSVVRLLHHHARQPQLQERMGAAIADQLLEALDARTVIVRLEARHLCMEMRGVRSPGTILSQCLRGKPDPELEGLLGSPRGGQSPDGERSRPRSSSTR